VPTQRVLYWRLPAWAEAKFWELVNELEALDPNDEDRTLQIHDEIRSLPGFPLQATEADLIRREITTVTH
jgi:hypothetical protein